MRAKVGVDIMTRQKTRLLSQLWFMEPVRYSIFVIRWLWRHRTWQDTRQKYKAMNKEWEARRNG
jgi:hypothetical protein